jgi:hypothetical protein
MKLVAIRLFDDSISPPISATYVGMTDKTKEEIINEIDECQDYLDNLPEFDMEWDYDDVIEEMEKRGFIKFEQEYTTIDIRL